MKRKRLYTGPYILALILLAFVLGWLARPLYYETLRVSIRDYGLGHEVVCQGRMALGELWIADCQEGGSHVSQ